MQNNTDVLSTDEGDWGRVTITDVVLWSISLALFIVYHVYFLVQYNKPKSKIGLGKNMNTRRRFVC